MSETTAIQKYGGWTPDQVQEQEADVRKKVSEWFSFPEGDTRLRFLPSPNPGSPPFVTLHQHRVKLPGKKQEIVVNCREMMLNEACPVCELMKKMKKSRDPSERENAGDLYPKFRVIAQVAIRKFDDKGNIVETVGPKKIGIGKKVFEKLVKLRKNPDYGDITDPSPNGVDITISRTGTTMNDTTYEAVPSRRACGLGDLSIIDKCDDLSDFAKVPSYDNAVAMLRGEGAGRDSDDGEDTSTQQRGRSVSDDLERDKTAANQRGGAAAASDDDIPF